MKAPRRAFLASAGALASTGISLRPAGAAEFDYKFATENGNDHHMTIRWIEAAEKIRHDSNGRLDIKVFANGALGGQTEALSQVRLGAIQFTSAADFILANVVPLAGITSTPFIFPTHKEAWATMDGPLGRYRRAAIAKAGVYPFAKSWDEGFRQIINAVRPIRTPDDLKGLKMRTPDSPVVPALFRAFGSSPVTVSGPQMYTALQTHLADGVEIPLASVESNKLYEVTKYVSDTNHIWSSYTMIGNEAAWQKLPKNLQDIVTKYVDGAADASNNDVVKLDSSIEATLAGQGLVFNRPEIAPFQTIVKKSGLYGTWAASYGPEAWALLERAVGKLS